MIARRPQYEEALAIAHVTASALAKLNAIGLVHQDIKPGNVLMDADGCPWLADFRSTSSKEHLIDDVRIPWLEKHLPFHVRLNAHTRRYGALERNLCEQMAADYWVTCVHTDLGCTCGAIVGTSAGPKVRLHLRGQLYTWAHEVRR